MLTPPKPSARVPRPARSVAVALNQAGVPKHAPSFSELAGAKLPSFSKPFRVYATLKEQVLAGTLPPGTKINERQLGAQLGVSRTPLREALNRLAHERLVLLSPYEGYTVAPLTRQDFVELCELRLILEPAVASLAARHASDEEIATLRRLTRVGGDAGEILCASFEQYLRRQSEFHLTLAHVARNERLEVLVMNAYDQQQRILACAWGHGLELSPAHGEHGEIAEAVARHNAPEAATLMSDHVRRHEGRVLDALEHYFRANPAALSETSA